MKLDEVMSQLESLGSESTKRTLLKHGAIEPFFGVKVGDLKPLAKKLKGQQQLAMDLYATKNSDAMYLAGLIADGSKMTRKDLDRWAAMAPWNMIAGYAVPWVASEHPEAFGIALKWIDSNKELVATAGWSTLAAIVSMKPDDELSIPEIKKLLNRCQKDIHASPNRVRYAMNGFVICVGTYVELLGDEAIKAARKIGDVTVDMGETSCQVPSAEPYIMKSRKGNTAAAKRKSARC
jgi:3-methyladenine DNA glycosylase AlkD